MKFQKIVAFIIGAGLSLMYHTINAEESTSNNKNTLSTPFQALRESDVPLQISTRFPKAVLKEVRAVLNVEKAWKMFDVQGQRMTVAILDSGLAINHPDFDYGDRVIEGKNFTPTNETNKTEDDSGHGTHVTGIIAARRETGSKGIAPYSNIVPLKVIYGKNNETTPQYLLDALNWILNYNTIHQESPISVVNISLDPLVGNYCWIPIGDCIQPNPEIIKYFQPVIQTLRINGVAVVAAAGNGYGTVSYPNQGCFTEQGMGFPAIIPEVISVASVYDANLSESQYICGARAIKRVLKFPAPYSRRLGDDQGRGTDFLAPGSVVRSSGLVENGYSESMDGSSQAAPSVSGVILLLQQYWKLHTGQLPSVDQIESWLHQGAATVLDSQPSEPVDNVRHTNFIFHLVDAERALNQAKAELNRSRP